MAILASFDLSPTKSAVKTSLSGTTALDDSFEIRATAPSQLSSFQVVGGSLIFTLALIVSESSVPTIIRVSVDFELSKLFTILKFVLYRAFAEPFLLTNSIKLDDPKFGTLIEETVLSEGV